jgi:pimeloyl-ACP methyl ester carboxylesterase
MTDRCFSQAVRVLTFALLMVPATARAAAVDGAEVHWTATGRGPAIIFVHGWTCDATSWEAQVPEFSRTHRVITLDLPGHGQSAPPKDGHFSMELFARAVEAVREDAGIDRAIVVGHSMGGPVVRQSALMYPQHVAALALVDGLVLMKDGNAGAPPQPMTGPEGLKARENMVRGMFGPNTTPANQQHILKMMMRTSEQTAAGAMSATRDQSTWTNDPVTVPVLGIYADKSRLANRTAMKILYPSLEYHEVPGTGHFVMMDDPVAFNALLTGFIQRIRY